MKFFISGILTILASLCVVIILFLVINIFSAEVFRSAILGILAALLFVSSGFIAFKFALKFQQKEFNKIIGISILSRLVLMTIVIVSIFNFSDLDKMPFLIGMFVSYFLFQIWEVVSFNKLTTGKI